MHPQRLPVAVLGEDARVRLIGPVERKVRALATQRHVAQILHGDVAVLADPADGAVALVAVYERNADGVDVAFAAVGVARVHLLRAERAEPSVGADARVGCAVLQASSVVVTSVAVTLARSTLPDAPPDDAFGLV